MIFRRTAPPRPAVPSWLLRPGYRPLVSAPTPPRRVGLPLLRYVIYGEIVATLGLALGIAIALVSLLYTERPSGATSMAAGSPGSATETSVLAAHVGGDAEMAGNVQGVAVLPLMMPVTDAAPLRVVSPPSRPGVRGEAAATGGRVLAGRAIKNVNVTFYTCLGEGFCGRMYNGQTVYEGAAACSFDLPIGTQFVISGDPTDRIYRCDDRGRLSPTWVDIYWYSPDDGWPWQQQVGRYATIEIVSAPAN